MLLPEIRQRMLDIIGSGASGISSDKIDPYLNVAHQSIVPAKVGGTYTRRHVDFYITDAADEYDLALATLVTTSSPELAELQQTIAIHEPMLDVAIGKRLDFYTDPTTFWERFGSEGNTPGRPIAVLVHENHTAVFRPYPDAEYPIRMYGLFGPPPLGNAGINESAIAMLVAAEAAVLWAAAFGKSDTMQRASAMADRLLSAAQLPYYAGSRGGERLNPNDWGRP